MKNYKKATRREFIFKSGMVVGGLGLVTTGLSESFLLNAGSELNSVVSDTIVGIKPGLIDQKDAKSLGLKTIQAEHEILYNVRNETYKYSHIPQLTVYKDRLYAMWSSGLEHEDWNGQRVMWTYTKNGKDWNTPTVLVDDPDGEDGLRFAVAAGFHSSGNKLIAYYTSTVHNKSESDYFAITSNNGRRWSKPYKIAAHAHVIESPRQLPGGRLLVGGMYPNRNPRILYTDSSDGISGWKDAAVPTFPEEFQRAFPEPSWFVCADGTISMLFRATRKDPWLYASNSNDNGETWSNPFRTNIPSATSRMSAGNLPDGRAFCIWNPSQHTDLPHRGRNPLVIALSSDCELFDKAYVIRNEPAALRDEGISKLPGWQYPSAIVWRNALWVGYSVNKEDIIISRIPLFHLN